jgi:hypothetical protein
VDHGVLDLRVICGPLPDPFGTHTDVRLGMQREAAVLDEQPTDGESLEFRCEVRVEPNAKTGAPNFLGPYAHGTPDDRFLYLVWTAASSHGRMGFSRIKIYLRTIDWALIRSAWESGRPLEVRISGRRRNGAPAAASVPLLEPGWHLG